MSHALTLTNPTNTQSAQVEPRSLTFEQELNEPASLSYDLPSRWTDYFDDTDSTNVQQLKSLISFSRGGVTEFAGEVLNIDLIQDGASADQRMMRVECADNLLRLKQARASFGGDAFGKKKTTTTTYGAGSEISMVPLVASSTDYYPDPTDTTKWLSITGSPRTVNTSGQAISIGDPSITTTGNISQRMRPRGLLVIGVAAEYVFYDGYDTNGSNYVFSNVTRGCLGSSDSNHSGGVALNQWQPRRIDPESSVTVEGDVGGGSWVVIDPSLYDVVYEDGYIKFASDPSGSYSGGIRLNCTLFDEDDADAFLLGGDNTYGVIELLCLETAANGGPGLTTGQLNIDLPRVVLPITELDASTNALDTIARLLSERVYSGITYDAVLTDDYPVAYYWDSPNGDFVIDILKDSAFASTAIPRARRVVNSNSMNDVYSEVTATWTEDLVNQSQLIKVSGSTGGTAGSVYNTTVNAKLLGNSRHKHTYVDYGEISAGAAISAGRRYLRNSWFKAYSHAYVLEEVPATLPQVGKKYTMPDGVDGFCISRKYTMTAGVETFEMTILDVTEVIGG